MSKKQQGFDIANWKFFSQVLKIRKNARHKLTNLHVIAGIICCISIVTIWPRGRTRFQR